MVRLDGAIMQPQRVLRMQKFCTRVASGSTIWGRLQDNEIEEDNDTQLAPQPVAIDGNECVLCGLQVLRRLADVDWAIE